MRGRSRGRTCSVGHSHATDSREIAPKRSVGSKRAGRRRRGATNPPCTWAGSRATAPVAVWAKMARAHLSQRWEPSALVARARVSAGAAGNCRPYRDPRRLSTDAFWPALRRHWHCTRPTSVPDESGRGSHGCPMPPRARRPAGFHGFLWDGGAHGYRQECQGRSACATWPVNGPS